MAEDFAEEKLKNSRRMCKCALREKQWLYLLLVYASFFLLFSLLNLLNSPPPAMKPLVGLRTYSPIHLLPTAYDPIYPQ